jgi:hypothetical protein
LVKAVLVGFPLFLVATVLAVVAEVRENKDLTVVDQELQVVMAEMV